MSKKYLMVTSNFDNWKQDFFKNYMSPRNKEYAKIHDFEYLEFLDVKEKYREHPSWLKFKLISNLLQEEKIKNGDVITQIDADMCIAKTGFNYVTNKSFSYSIDSANSHCMGHFSLRINDWSRNLVRLILDEDRYKKLQNHITEHEYFGFSNSFVMDFREQASWYYLAGIKRHSQKSFWKYPSYLPDATYAKSKAAHPDFLMLSFEFNSTFPPLANKHSFKFFLLDTLIL